MLVCMYEYTMYVFNVSLIDWESVLKQHVFWSWIFMWIMIGLVKGGKGRPKNGMN